MAIRKKNVDYHNLRNCFNRCNLFTYKCVVIEAVGNLHDVNYVRVNYTASLSVSIPENYLFGYQNKNQ